MSKRHSISALQKSDLFLCLDDRCVSLTKKAVSDVVSVMSTKMSSLTCGVAAALISAGALAQPVTFLMQDSQPKYFLDNAEQKGLCGDIYHALQVKLKERQVESEIQQHYLPIKRILATVEQDAGHVFCGSGRNEAREKRFTFAQVPVYHVSNVLAAHVSDKFEPQSFNDVIKNGNPVGALFGTSSARYLKQQLPGLVNDSFKDLNTPLKLIATPPYRLRYFYYHDLGLNYLVKTMDLPLKVISTKFRTVPQWLIYSNHTDKATAEAIELSLRDMEQSGELARIVSQYIY